MTGRNASYAVVLNAQARGYHPRVAASLEPLIPPDRLFITHSEEEGDAVIRQLVDRGVPTVFTGGGDGTVVRFINRAFESGVELPDIGILRLGTGNALARMVSSGHYLCDITNFMGTRSRDLHVLRLIESEGRRFPFAGLGRDAEILNDYLRLKQTYDRPLFRPIVQNVTGYFAGLFAYTIPRRIMGALRRQRTSVCIRNTGSPAAVLNAQGETVGHIPPGEILFEGVANAVMVGTCPYYGYGMKVMPWAEQDRDRMQLRVSTLNLARLLYKLPDVWRGEYDGPGMHDFLVDGIEVESSEPFPYQEAGDGLGYRDKISFALSPATVNLVRYI